MNNIVIRQAPEAVKNPPGTRDRENQQGRIASKQGDEAGSVIDSNLLYNFVHQVINPLNGVVGTLDNLIAGVYSDPDKRMKKLNATKAQVEHTIEMVRNLAYLAELESESGLEALKSKSSFFNICTIAIESAQFYQELASNKGVRIRVSDMPQFEIQCHENLLKQVLMNLIENAVKYSDNDSDISIGFRVQKKSRLLMVEVENRGIGFSNADACKLFELNYRAPEAKALKASGSGIGLYVCSKIVEKGMSGSIEAVHIDRDRKTIFRLKFPTYREVE